VKRNLIILLLLVGYFVACSQGIKPDRTQELIEQAKKPGKVPTPAIIADVVIEQGKARDALQDPKTGAKVTIEGLEPNDPAYVQKRGHAVAKIDEATTHIDTGTEKAKAAMASATLDVKEKGVQAKQIQKYREADPVLAWLNLIAIVAIAFGGIGIVASFFLPTLLPPLIARHARAGGLALIVYGFFMAALAEFLDETRLIFWLLGLGALAVGLVWAIAWAIRNRKRFNNAVDKIEAGVAAGQIIITEDAKNPAVSMAKAKGDPDTEMAIQARQAKLRKLRQKEHAHVPNLHAIANGPDNLTSASGGSD
jgi:hypothetical protein